MTAVGRQFGRFLVGGLANTIITFGIFLLLAELIPPTLAYTAAYIIGIALSYLINTAFVFRSTASIRSALQYPIVYAVQYGLGLVIIAAMTGMGHSNALAMALVICVNVPLSFLMTRFVLRPRL